MPGPDILLLVLDAQRADHLSCYGYALPTSPHLDALAAEATRFTQAIAPAQWTIPAHAALFTGLYPSQHGMLQYDSVLPAGLPTLAERLREAGYFTAAFSNNPLVGVLDNGLQRGFDRVHNYSGLLTWRGRGIPMPRPRSWSWLPRSQGGPGIPMPWPGPIAARLLGRVQALLTHSHALRSLWFSRPMVPLWQMALRLRGNLKGDTPRSLSDAAHLLIERPGLAPDQPACVFVNLMGGHVPFEPPRWALERFVPSMGQRRSLAARLALWRFNARLYHRMGPLPEALDPQRQTLLNQLYAAEVAAQDEQVGLFVERLRAAGALERTLLMVTADHGELLGEKQLLGHGFSAYQGLAHVPLLVRDPRGDLPRGATRSGWVSTRRLFHTALAAAGAATPAEQALALQAGDGGDPDQGVVFAEAEPLQAAARLIEGRRPGLLRALGYDLPQRAVYAGEYKLILTGEQRAELYAVQADPQEDHDLATAMPERVAAMRAYLERLSQPAAGAVPGQADPESELIEQRLRALGYL